MSAELVVRNCQRAFRLDGAFLREVTRHLLEMELGLNDYELGIQFVSGRRMAEVNQHFLRHEGPTDVITFDYRDSAGDVEFLPQPRNRRRQEAHSKPGDGEWSLLTSAATIHGELFICPAVAAAQAKEFRTSLPEELVRYLIHGVLHLLGFDDLNASDRKAMKREEARLLRHLARRFNLRQVRNAIR